MHGREFNDILKEVKPRGKGFANTSIHPQFVAAMIRIGDLLDIDNNRFSPYAVRHFGRLPLSSMAHLKKHKSITHFDISEHQISVEAHAKEYEAAILAKDWFGWIDSEIENLICAWNDIVPEGLYGCTLTKSNCKVYLLDEGSGEYHLFNSNIQRDFSVNKKRLIKLLIGASLYESKMEFLREYIQNALDATKMQLWIDLKNGNHRLQKNPKADLNEIIPLDLEDAVYKNYSIKLCVEWNKTKDKILIKIIDRGIGIESEYLNHLLHIGTGWRGRICYEDELREMPGWLYPTGGFGIGIQSAFMVTDAIEILTKSNKDMQGYRIILRSPEKNGSVSVEEVSGIYGHGTTITVEIEPERIQNWKEQADKKKFLLSNIKSDFNARVRDIFCPDALIEYAGKFLEDYVNAYIPNPLFPIEICIPRMKESITCYKPYWTGERYWEAKSEYIEQEIPYEGKTYLCVYNPNEKKFMVWSYSDGVFQVIKLENRADLENIKICFKNVCVKDADKSVLEDYCGYHTCIDFMGFKAENCLKVHRNFFNEEFKLEEYCRRGFLLYFFYLKEHMDLCKDEWNEFEAQLLLISVFNTVFEKETDDIQKRIEIEKYTFVLNEQNRYDIKRERKREQIYLTKILNAIYRKSDDSNEIAGGMSGNGVAVLPTKEMWSIFSDEKKGSYLISSKNVKQWQETGDIDGKNGKLKVQILNAVAKETGVITEERIVSLLLRHKRLNRVRVDFGGEEKFLYLFVPEKEAVYKEQEFYEFFTKTDDDGRERKVLSGKNTERYEKLCVSKLPYAFEKVDRKYLIAPFTKEDYKRVKIYQYRRRKLDYSVFRELVWGKKGEETQNYHMMIDWVYEHQYQKECYSRREIKEEYEIFLKKIYQKCVRDEIK